MIKGHESDQAGKGKGAVSEDKASAGAKPGELSVEELAKVSGGRTAYTVNQTNSLAYKVPTLNTFTKG